MLNVRYAFQLCSTQPAHSHPPSVLARRHICHHGRGAERHASAEVSARHSVRSSVHSSFSQFPGPHRKAFRTRRRSSASGSTSPPRRWPWDSSSSAQALKVRASQSITLFTVAKPNAAVRALLVLAVHYIALSPGDDGGAGVLMLTTAVQSCLQVNLNLNPLASLADDCIRRTSFNYTVIRASRSRSALQRRAKTDDASSG